MFSLSGIVSTVTGALSGWQGYAAALGCGLVLGGLGVWRVESWKEQAQVTQAAVATVRKIELADSITYQVGITFQGISAADQAHTNELLEEVSVHVTPEIDLTHPVPCGFVLMFNGSTHGTVPDPATCPDDAPSGVTLSDVARATVENNGEYDQVAHQLSALQDWVRQQEGVH